MGRQEEIELAIELAITKLDMKHAVEVEKLRGEIPEIISEKIGECQRHQERRRRWNASTGIAILAVLISLGTLIATHWPG